MRLSLSRSGGGRLEWIDGETANNLREIATSLGEDSFTIGLVLVDDGHIRRINREFRGVDRATDIISFSYMEEGQFVGEDDVAGELYISYETLEKEAKKQGVDTRHLFLRVALHGLLHILGFDHGSRAEELKMEQEEKKVLGRFLASEDVEALF